MEKAHVKSCFDILVPFDRELTSATPDVATKPNLCFIVVDKYGETTIYNIRVFVKLRLSSKEFEQSDCLSWKKRSPLTIQSPSESDIGQRWTLILRLRVNQGVFDLRNSKRFVRLEIGRTNPAGQIPNQATSQFFQLLPRKRNRDMFSLKDRVVIQTQWLQSNDYNSASMQIEPMPTSDSNNNNMTGYLSLDDNELLELFTGQGELSTSNDEQNTSQAECLAVSDSPNQLQVYSEDSPEHIQPPSSISHEGHEHESYMVLYNGNAEVIGNFRALNFYKASDINIKQDVRLLVEDDDPRDVLLKIDGVHYRFKSSVKHSTNKRFVGYIAQQIESVVPEAVQLIDGILHVDYESLIPYLSESIKQNFKDIKNISSEQERIKLIVDMLYDDFLKRERTSKQQNRTVVAPEPESFKPQTVRGTWPKIIGSIIGAILLMTAVMFGVYTLIEQQPHVDNNNTAPLQTLVPTRSLETDRRVLEDLFIATNGGSWDYSSDKRAVRWMSEAPMCKWLGVACTKGRVTEVRLTVMNLSGTIPDSIGELDALENLNLAINNLTGTIPASIKNLKNLGQLWLDVNPRLTGSIPELPINLWHVWLQYCNFTGSIPRSISNLTSVRELRLDTNQLSGSLPPLPVSENFAIFNASDNQLEGSLPTFTPHTAVGTFDVSHNKMSGTIENLSQLAFANAVLNDNQFSGEVEYVMSSKSWVSFVVNNNNFTSFNSSAPDPHRKRLQCDTSNNPLKCPIPPWVSLYCKATCT